MTSKFFTLLVLLGVCGLPTFAQYKLEGNNLVLPSPIIFKTGSDHIAEESEKMLGYLKTYLESKPSVTLLRIEGHVADAKSVELAQSLSEKRALAVAKALVKLGVDCKRLLPVGFGSTKPIEDNATPTGKAKNTRIVIANAELRTKPIGGMPIDGGGKVTSSACQK